MGLPVQAVEPFIANEGRVMVREAEQSAVRTGARTGATVIDSAPSAVVRLRNRALEYLAKPGVRKFAAMAVTAGAAVGVDELIDAIQAGNDDATATALALAKAAGEDTGNVVTEVSRMTGRKVALDILAKAKGMVISAVQQWDSEAHNHYSADDAGKMRLAKDIKDVLTRHISSNPQVVLEYQFMINTLRDMDSESIARIMEA